MKRIVREVITLIRVERWLVTDDSPASPIPETEEMDWSFLEARLGHDASSAHVYLPLKGETADRSPDGSHVISQRVIDVRTWEVKHE